EERRDFWIMLRALAGAEKTVVEEVDVESKVRAEVVGRITQGLMKLAGGNGEGIADFVVGETVAKTTPVAVAEAPSNNGSGDYMAPWLETDECTACDECTKLNPKIFAYNGDKKAYIQNPNGGPYSDLVKAAEKCTARVIHPGLPADRKEKDIDKWIKRGEKYN
ncbi:MAG: ferredoxin, partial [Bacteroidetes bacterium]|nr:ferredoxin [Bacteroidota bacterium]